MVMFGFIACDKHECVDHDHSADIVGTWTCIDEDFAEALVISADGTVVSTRLFANEYREDVKGTIVVENGNVTLTFEDGGNFKSHFDIIPGMAFSIFNEEGERLTYNYCKEDLSEKIVGMWVYQNGTSEIDNDMYVQTYNADGTTNKSGWSVAAGDFIVNNTTTYKVVGDLVFYKRPSDILTEGMDTYVAASLVYVPNANSLGDILISTGFAPADKGNVKVTASHLRIKQSLDLAGKKYDYIKTFVTNVDGLDKDINFMGFEFNFAKMDGVKLDKMLKALLFNVEFPDANTIKYACHYNNEPMSMDAPIVVDGNKMTVKMSTKNAAYKDVDLYTFQDKDNTQMHMYMPTYAFINFFGNMQATIMSQMGDLDLTDAAAVKAVFDSIDEAVKTINVSFVMTKATKAL